MSPGEAQVVERRDQVRGALKLLLREQAQRVAHDRGRAAPRGTEMQASRDRREGDRSEIGFGLAAAGRKPDQVDEFGVGVSVVPEFRQHHQQKRELERPPRPAREMRGIHVRHAPRVGRCVRLLDGRHPCRVVHLHEHGAVCESERVQRVGLRREHRDSRPHPLDDRVDPPEDPVARVPQIARIAG